MRQQLLCTFTYQDNILRTLDEIYEAYTSESVNNLKCYFYTQAPNNFICVYNTMSTANKARNTILINKKAETNTLYSINALNSIIQELNNGILDKKYIIDWSQYKDNLLLTDKETGYKKIHITELKKIPTID